MAVKDVDLAETFCPQWVHVVKAVRSAALLTPAEAVALDAAWEAAKIPSWECDLDSAGIAQGANLLDV